MKTTLAARWISLYFVMTIHLVGFAFSATVRDVPQLTLTNEGVVPKQWLFLGPFTAESGQAAMEVDFLKSATAAESQLTIEGLGADAAKIPAPDHLVRVSDCSEIVDFLDLFGLPRPTADLETAVYALCEIRAAGARDVWLLLGSDDGAKVWLNGELLHAFLGGRALRQYSDAVKLPLRAGRNLLVLKIGNRRSGWAMTARLEPSAQAAARSLLATHTDVVRNRVVGPGQPLELILSPWPKELEIAVLIEPWIADSPRSKPVVTTVAANLSQVDLPKGLNRLVMEVDGARLNAGFFVGSFSELRMAAETDLASLQVEERIALNLGTLVRRLEILERASRDEKFADEKAREVFLAANAYKAVWAAGRFRDAEAEVRRGVEPFRHRSGLHLRGFRSRIDDQPMHYRIFVPASYRPEGEALPMIVIPATVVTANRPFIASAFVAQHVEAELLAAVADKLNVGLLWPGYRMQPYGNPADFAYLDEVLAEVGQDYHIDHERISVWGSCSSGMIAAMDCIRLPERYSALALMNPVIHRLKHRFDDQGAFSILPEYQAWLKKTDPLEPLAALAGLPIWIIHNGVDPDHGPLAHSVDFGVLARALGQRPRLDLKSAGKAPHAQLIAEQFAWLAQQRRRTIDDASRARPQPTSAGSIAAVVAERFLVVRGTGGSERQRASSAAWCERWSEAWRKTCFVPCRLVDDVNLTREDSEMSNLVLIGNAATNAVWARIGPLMPLRANVDGVVIGNQRWMGRSLAMQAWWPHPEVPGRKVAFIGAGDLVAANVGAMELALDGWFDWAVWKQENGHTELVAAGHHAK